MATSTSTSTSLPSADELWLSLCDAAEDAAGMSYDSRARVAAKARVRALIDAYSIVTRVDVADVRTRVQQLLDQPS